MLPHWEMMKSANVLFKKEGGASSSQEIRYEANQWIYIFWSVEGELPLKVYENSKRAFIIHDAYW